MFTWIWVFLLCSWKNKNIIFKIRRSKVTDYAALNQLIDETIYRLNSNIIVDLLCKTLKIIFCWKKIYGKLLEKTTKMKLSTLIYSFF